MNRKKVVGLLVGLLCFLASAGYAQTKWELQKKEDGIEVYTRDVAGNPLKEIRVVCELPGSPNLLVDLLKDVEHHSDWVYLNRKTKLLKRKNENSLIYYTEADMPWPLTDRDMVVEANFTPASKNNQARVEVRSISEYLPHKKEFVRIPSSLAVWDITPLAKGNIKIDYTFRVNPGGSVPAWLVNATVATGPTKTFQNLRKVLTQRAKDHKNI